MSALYGPNDLKRCLVISGIVGTVLVSINQGPSFFLSAQGGWDVLARVALNYLVPFTVASVSSIATNRTHRRRV